MKNTREKLISLLGLCSDDETETTRLQRLSSITQSADYSALRKSVALKKPFDALFDHSKLAGLSNSELKERKSILHKLLSFNDQLIQSIRYGNGPSLNNEDLPDFSSLKSISQACEKIKVSKNLTNYTNISEEKALAIFSDTTIKAAQKCLDILPVSIAKSNRIDETMIREHIGNSLFCINIEEFESCHKSFLEFAKESEDTIVKEKNRKRKHIFVKLAIIMLCFGALFACSQFGLFSDTFSSVMQFFMLIASILFLIWG